MTDAEVSGALATTLKRRGAPPDAMRVLVTGASGLVGQETVRALQDRGHDVVASSRDPTEHDWPPGVEAVAWDGPDAAPVQDLDGIINLAGASIGGKRWSTRYKQTILDSRLRVTQGAVATADRDGAALINASAIGVYGRDPRGVCHEDRPPGDDYLAQVCRQWEATAMKAGPRTAVLRFGHVLDADEGILGRLVPLYKARLGGRIASGKQGLPWVHKEDVARALVWALEGDAEGAYNLAAPEAATQADLDRELGRALGVCHAWRIPGFAMRIAVGELGPYLVGGQTTPPDRLREEGFSFRHPTLRGAMEDLFDGPKARRDAEAAQTV